MENNDGLVLHPKVIQLHLSREHGRFAAPCHQDRACLQALQAEDSQKKATNDFLPEEEDLREYYRVR